MLIELIASTAASLISKYGLVLAMVVAFRKAEASEDLGEATLYRVVAATIRASTYNVC